MKTQYLLSTILLLSFQAYGLESELYKSQNGEFSNDILFVVFHGCFQTKADVKEGMEWNEMADAKGFHVLYLGQTEGSHRNNCWNWNDDNELASIHAEIIRTVEENSIDSEKVYLVGFSSGGQMVGRLAACYPDDYAGIVAHSSSAKSILRKQNGPFGARSTKFCNFRDYFGKILLVYGTRDWVTPKKMAEEWIDAYFGYIPESRQKRFRPKGKYAFKTVDYFESEFFQLQTAIIDRLGHEWSGGVKNKSFFNSNSIDIRSHIWDYFRP